MVIGSVLGSVFSKKKDHPIIVNGYDRLNEFKSISQPAFGAQYVTEDDTVYNTRKELRSIFEEIRPQNIEEDIFVTFFEKGALLYAESGSPILYCENARLGYSGSGVDVSRILLEEYGKSPATSEEIIGILQCKVKRQRRHPSCQDGRYVVTIRV